VSQGLHWVTLIRWYTWKISQLCIHICVRATT